MKTRKTIDKNWNKYDQMVAECHLANYGIIYLDEYNQPVDVEELEYIINE